MQASLCSNKNVSELDRRDCTIFWRNVRWSTLQWLILWREFYLGIKKNQWWIIKHKNDKLDFIKIKKFIHQGTVTRGCKTTQNLSHVLKICNPEYTENSCQSTTISSQKIQLKIREVNWKHIPMVERHCDCIKIGGIWVRDEAHGRTLYWAPSSIHQQIVNSNINMKGWHLRVLRPPKQNVLQRNFRPATDHIQRPPRSVPFRWNHTPLIPLAGIWTHP